MQPAQLVVIDQSPIEFDRSGRKILDGRTDDQLAQVANSITDPIRTSANRKDHRNAAQTRIGFQVQNGRRVIRFLVKRVRAE